MVLSVLKHAVHRSALAALDVYGNIPKAQFGGPLGDLRSHRFACCQGKLARRDLEPQKLVGMQTCSDIVEAVRMQPFLHGFDSAQSADRYNLSISDPACKAGAGRFVGGGQSPVLSNLADGLFVVP